MKILVDADACPNKIKEILFKAASKRKIETIFVANQYLNLAKSPFIKMLRVEKGFDEADNKISELANRNDLVITSDIPLAADVVDKGALAISHRGERFSAENVKQKLALRDTFESMRETGIEISGPPTLHPRDLQQFANALDKHLSQFHKPT